MIITILCANRLCANFQDRLDINAQNLLVRSIKNMEITASIQKEIPNFKVTYKPDFRQAIADSWPASIDDSAARRDWGWKLEFDLDGMTKDMLLHLEQQYGKKHG